MYNHGTDMPGMGYMQGHVNGALYGGAPSNLDLHLWFIFSFLNLPFVTSWFVRWLFVARLWRFLLLIYYVICAEVMSRTRFRYINNSDTQVSPERQPSRAVQPGL
jgi:hypothetical protein